MPAGTLKNMTKSEFNEEWNDKIANKISDHFFGEQWKDYIRANLHKLSTEAIERITTVGPHNDQDGGWSAEIVSYAATILLERAMV